MSKNIKDLRDILFKTMEELRDGKIDTAKAKEIANLGQVIVNSAVAETKHLRDHGGKGSGFIEVNAEVISSQPQLKITHREETLSEHEKTLRKYGV